MIKLNFFEKRVIEYYEDRYFCLSVFDLFIIPIGMYSLRSKIRKYYFKESDFYVIDWRRKSD